MQPSGDDKETHFSEKERSTAHELATDPKNSFALPTRIRNLISNDPSLHIKDVLALPDLALLQKNNIGVTSVIALNEWVEQMTDIMGCPMTRQTVRRILGRGSEEVETLDIDETKDGQNKVGVGDLSYWVRQIPDELRSVSPSVLRPLPSRVETFLRVEDIRVITELERYDDLSLLHRPNFGQTSLLALVTAIRELINEHESVLHSERLPGSEREIISSFEGGWTQAYNSMDSRMKDILTARCLSGSNSLTLQELGNKHDITRERVRQIERKGRNHLIAYRSFGDLVDKKLHAVRLDRSTPLSVLELIRNDRWFSIGDHSFDRFNYQLFLSKVELLSKDHHVIQLPDKLHYIVSSQIDSLENAQQALEVSRPASITREGFLAHTIGFLKNRDSSELLSTFLPWAAESE